MSAKQFRPGQRVASIAERHPTHVLRGQTIELTRGIVWEVLAPQTVAIKFADCPNVVDMAPDELYPIN